jgi:hypothetical protein
VEIYNNRCLDLLALPSSQRKYLPIREFRHPNVDGEDEDFSYIKGKELTFLPVLST